jgi:hypothetical protein
MLIGTAPDFTGNGPVMPMDRLTDFVGKGDEVAG